MAGYGNGESGEVESLVTLWVRLPPRLLAKGCWSNGTTPGLQPGNRGSTPRPSTAQRGLMVQRDDTRLAVWESGFDSR